MPRREKGPPSGSLMPCNSFMKATINTSLLAKLSPRTKPYDVRDDKLTGFLVRVNISGKLVYMCEFTRGKRITIGKADARVSYFHVILAMKCLPHPIPKSQIICIVKHIYPIVLV